MHLVRINVPHLDQMLHFHDRDFTGSRHHRTNEGAAVNLPIGGGSAIGP